MHRSSSKTRALYAATSQTLQVEHRYVPPITTASRHRALRPPKGCKSCCTLAACSAMLLRLACLLTLAAAKDQCSCANAVPSSKSVDLLEDAFAKRVAGRRRTKQAVLAAIRQQASAASSGRAAPLRLHFTGPSGVGKSFLAQLVAAKFEESRRYTGYATIGAGAATAASVATGAVVAKVSTWGALVAVVSSPIAVAGGLLGLLSAALFGWQAGDLADAYWGTAPAPYPTQCGVSWWKFAAFSDEKDAVTDARGAVKAAASAVFECPGAVVVLEDVNRLPPAALRALEPLTQPLLERRYCRTDVASDHHLHVGHYTGPDSADAGILEPGMSANDAAHVHRDKLGRCGRRRARLVRDAASFVKRDAVDAVVPRRWARDVATLACRPSARGIGKRRGAVLESRRRRGVEG